VPGHIRIVNDPVELVPLLMTFNDPSFKKVYELLHKSWLTEGEIKAQINNDSVAVSPDLKERKSCRGAMADAKARRKSGKRVPRNL